MKVLKEELDENPVDSHYKALKCGLSSIEKTSSDFKVIQSILLHDILFVYVRISLATWSNEVLQDS